MLQRITLKLVLALGLLAGASAPAQAQVFPHEQALVDAALLLADVLDTAGYPQSASEIRKNCTDPKKWLQCVEVTALHAASFMLFREHEVVGTVYTTLGEDEAARDYANCERDPSLTGVPNEFGSYHCAEHLVNDPFWIALRTSMHTLADGAELAGYPNEAAIMRRACQYQGDVNFEFMGCALSTVELLLAITEAPRAAGVPVPRCTATGLVPACTVLRPQPAALSDLDAFDQTGDARFSVTDLTLLAGSGSVLDQRLDDRSEAASQRWVQQMLNVLAAGPVVADGTPLADDYMVLLRALAAAETAPASVASRRRAGRLTP